MSSEPTTITLPATKSKGYGRNAGVSVSIDGPTVWGHGSTLAEAKQDALSHLLELATIQQSGVAATVFERRLTVYYPQGTGSGMVTIDLDSPRITCTGSTVGTPTEAAERAAQQSGVERVR